LPLLLDSIRLQNIPNLEVIVADANSTDRTREIAKKYGCKIVEGGLPAKGRNMGVKESKGELLIFVDSDVILPPNFLKNAVKEFNYKKLDVAGTLQNPSPIQGKVRFNYKIIYSLANQFMLVIKGVKPHMQVCMFSKREIHDKINGFDEKIVYAEDSNYAERAGKVGKFGILKNEKVLISPRRFEGNLSSALKYALMSIARLSGYEFHEDKTKIRYFR
jgi:glycosyltransferase involved in cell wall biosynthesis